MCNLFRTKARCGPTETKQDFCTTLSTEFVDALLQCSIRSYPRCRFGALAGGLAEADYAETKTSVWTVISHKIYFLIGGSVRR